MQRDAEWRAKVYHRAMGSGIGQAAGEPPGVGVTLHREAGEGETLLAITGLVPDVDALVADAAGRSFAPVGPHYPGVRAAAGAALAGALRAAVAPLIARHFGLDPAPAVLEAYFSLVTTPPERLAPIQRLPHFDGVERERLALLLFLSDTPGGTAFYRHRATGFETITAARLGDYDRALHADVARHGLPPAAYIAGDTPIFERVSRHAGTRGTALLYRGHRLHCADLPPATPLSADPRRGRLTLNLFLHGPGGG